MNAVDQIEVTEGSGNVDLGLPDADELYVKSLLSIVIARTLRQRRLARATAARILGTTEAAIRDVVRGRLSGFAVERLSQMLTALG